VYARARARARAHTHTHTTYSMRSHIPKTKETCASIAENKLLLGYVQPCYRFDRFATKTRYSLSIIKGRNKETMIVNLSFIRTKSFVNRQKYALRLRAMENCKSAISRERRLDDDDDNDVWSAPMHATVCTFVTRRISRWRVVGARISRRRRQIHDKIERSSIIHISSRISIVIHAGNKHSPFFAKLSEAHAAFDHRSTAARSCIISRRDSLAERQNDRKKRVCVAAMQMQAFAAARLRCVAMSTR